MRCTRLRIGTSPTTLARSCTTCAVSGMRWEAFSASKQETLRCYWRLVTAYRANSTHKPASIDELNRAVTEIEALAATRDWTTKWTSRRFSDGSTCVTLGTIEGCATLQLGAMTAASPIRDSRHALLVGSARCASLTIIRIAVPMAAAPKSSLVSWKTEP